MKKTKKRSLTLLLVLVLAVSGGVLLWKAAERAMGARAYEEALQMAGTDRAAALQAADGAERADPYAAALAETDLGALREVNSEVLAWVDIPGTELSYPVLQTGDNQYYLNHTWQNEKNSVGAVFMEHTCAPDLTDFHTILYGHRMRNGSMFGMLKHYEEQSFWEEHPQVYLVTDGGVYLYDIFSAFEVGTREIVYRLDLEESGLEEEFISFCLDNSVIDTGIVPEAGDRILTLSTCTGRGHATRWIVQGVLRGDGPAA